MRCASGAIARKNPEMSGSSYVQTAAASVLDANWTTAPDTMQSERAGSAVVAIGIVPRRSRQLETCSVLQRAIWTFSLSLPRATFAAPLLRIGAEKTQSHEQLSAAASPASLALVSSGSFISDT
jgi:hypothetical protein